MNIFDKPAEQPLMNTYVPVPWEHIFKLVDYGNKQIESGESAKQDIVKGLGSFKHIVNPEELEGVQALNDDYMQRIAKIDQIPNIIEKARKLRDLQTERLTDPRIKAYEARYDNAQKFATQEKEARDKVAGHKANEAPFILEKERLRTKGTFSKNADGSWNWDTPYTGTSGVEWTAFTDIEKEITERAAQYEETDLGTDDWHQTYAGLMERKGYNGVTAARLYDGFGVLPDLNDEAIKKSGYTREEWEEKRRAALSEALKRADRSEYGPQLNLEANMLAGQLFREKLAELKAEGVAMEDIDMNRLQAAAVQQAKASIYIGHVEGAVAKKARVKATYDTRNIPGWETAYGKKLEDRTPFFTAENGSTSFAPLSNPLTGTAVTTVTDIVDLENNYTEAIKEAEKNLNIDIQNGVVDSPYANELKSLEKSKKVADAWVAKLKSDFSGAEMLTIQKFEREAEEKWNYRGFGKDNMIDKDVKTFSVASGVHGKVTNLDTFKTWWVEQNLNSGLKERYKKATEPMLVSTHETNTLSGDKNTDAFMKQAMFHAFEDGQFYDKKTGLPVTKDAQRIIEKAKELKVGKDDVGFVMPVLTGTNPQAQIYGTITVGSEKYMVKAPQDARRTFTEMIGPGAEDYYTDLAHAKTLPSHSNATKAKEAGAYLEHLDAKGNVVGAWVNINGRPMYVATVGNGQSLFDPTTNTKTIAEKYNFVVK